MTAPAEVIEVENCDECGVVRPVNDLWLTIGHGLICDRCCEELRDLGLAG